MDKPYKNSGLFSDHYLSDKLPNLKVWQVESSELVKVNDKIKTVYQKTREELPDLSESALEERFIRPILRTLNHVYEVQPALTRTIEGTKKPDYAFFENEEVRTEAEKVSGKEEFFKKSLAIGEAKQWGRPLDKKLRTEKDPFEIQNPSLQMSRYLWLTGTKWGILTDGQFWRLYERETSKRIDIYYEVNLPALLEQGTISDFKYFYRFFNKEALLREADGKCLLDKIYQGSVDYREEVSGELKGNVYKALRLLAEGFLKNPTNNLSLDSLQDIHDNSLIFIYRLLFILYAEYRDLLPMDNSIYRDSYSLYALKQEIAEKIDAKAPLSQTMSHYHGKLKELFEVINVGNEELGVPPYNGGLFDPNKHGFLEKYRVGDFFLAQVIDKLSRSSDKAFVDYSSLDIRHLGSIYEGLLEYKLKMADEDMVAIKDKTEVWVSVSNVNGNPAIGGKIEYKKKGYRVLDFAPKGSPYLTTDKGERKATGSYYTPDYIVKYIVENTVGPLINEKKKLVQEKVKNLEEKIKTSRGYNQEQYEKQLREAENSLIDEILSLKVLDPAMGSGHFLVEATDYIARALVGVLSGEVSPEEEQEKVVSGVKERAAVYTAETMEEEDIRWARREVIEKCIFGVDLNPLTVELAKLSLWLNTVAKDRPLNFLDHHLRCGNSLIGARIDDLGSLPDLKKKEAVGGPVQLGLFESIFKEKINLLLGAFAQIELMPSDTVEQIRKKEELYQDFRKIVSRFQDVADVWTSVYFGNEVDFGEYQKLQDNLRAIDSEWERLKEEPWFEKAKEIARGKHFFSWELEFPEVFFEGHQKKENPGFDAVVGNPPYSGHGDSYESTFRMPVKLVGKLDVYKLMMFLGVELIDTTGFNGFIVPNSWLTNSGDVQLRRFLLNNAYFSHISEYTKHTFKDAPDVTPVVYIVGKQVRDQVRIRAKGKLPYHLCSDETRWELEDSILQEVWLNSKALVISLREIGSFRLRSKIDKISIELGKLANVSQGVILYHTIEERAQYQYSRKIGDNRIIGKNWKPLITASHFVEKYFVHPPKEEVSYGSWLYFTNKSEYFEKPKILYHRLKKGSMRMRLVAAIDNEGYYCLNNLSLVNLHAPTTSYKSHFILVLFNSYLMNWYYDMCFKNVNIQEVYVRSLPIRIIFFISSPKERDENLQKSKALYEDFSISSNSSEILDFVSKLLEKKYKPAPEIIKKHNADSLNKDWQIPEGALWEQSDIVHDILAFLAEQMIEMNKEKQAEIEGFLEWLEREIEAKIDNLRNKTKIKAYHEYSFDDLLSALKQNRRRLQIDPSHRDFQENLKSEFDKSLTKLNPLKEKIAKTDWLIDQIIYKLYGLTDEEIGIVEGSVSDLE